MIRIKMKVETTAAIKKLLRIKCDILKPETLIAYLYLLFSDPHRCSAGLRLRRPWFTQKNEAP